MAKGVWEKQDSLGVAHTGQPVDTSFGHSLGLSQAVPAAATQL